MKVLTVDDSAIIRKIAASSIEMLGYEVLQAADGVEALERLGEHGDSIGLVLMDWNMPNMNGFECLEKIVADEKLQSIPVMMVTTESEAGKVAKALRAGAVNYLTKPFTSEELAFKMLQCMGEAEADESELEALTEEKGEGHGQFADAFLAAGELTLDSMSMAELVIEEVTPEPRPEPAGLEVFARTHLSGAGDGGFRLSMPQDLAVRLVAAMLGAEEENLSREEVFDGVGELVNIMAGAAKTSLAGGGMALEFSVPEVQHGAWELVDGRPEGRGFVAVCTVGSSPVRLEGWLTEP